jgi:outer membrane lipoprotein-sorting protein
MNCIEIRERMADLFDDSVSEERMDLFSAHFRECADCRRLYEETAGAFAELKPRVTIRAGTELQKKILGESIQIGRPFRSGRGMILPMLTPGWKRVTAIAAVLAVLFILFPLLNRTGLFQNKATAANALLGKSISALEAVRSVYMEFKVRTLADENFEYIDMTAGFVSHKLWKVNGNPARWRIEKPGRTVVMDGKKQYLYVREPMRSAIVGDPDWGLVDCMKILFYPGKILQTEKDLTARHEATYQITEKGTDVVLTVKAKAMGDFRNTYALNKSIPESNNRRVYIFDKVTNRLKSLDVTIEAGNKETEILQLTTIRYNEPIADSTFAILLPADVKWIPLDKILSDEHTGIPGISSEEAARRLFKAWNKEEWKTVEQLMPGFMNSPDAEQAKKEFGGLMIVSIGKSFKSGQYPGEFVPYEVRLKSGISRKMNLALRCDNRGKRWWVDGGF